MKTNANKQTFKLSKAVLKIGIAVFVLVLAIFLWNPLAVFELKVSDLFYKSGAVPEDIVIIAIDEASLSKEAGLGRFKDWPRSYYSQLLRTIAPYKPAAVGFDLAFFEPSLGMSDLRVKQLLEKYGKFVDEGGKSGNFGWYNAMKRFEGRPDAAAAEGLIHPDDSDLQTAINEVEFPIVLASSLVFPAGTNTESVSTDFPPHESITEPIFRGENVTTGFVNILIDRDGVVRRFSPKAGDVKSFALAVVGAGKADAVTEVFVPQNSTLINYYSRPFSFRTISFVDVLANKFKPESIVGKIVLVGATAKIIQDFQNTPASRNPMAGVEINANAIQQILDNKFPVAQGTAAAIFFIVLFTIGGALLLTMVSLPMMAVSFAAGLFGILIVAFGLYQTGYIIDTVYLEIAWIFTGLATLWYRNRTELRAKREIKKAFAHYVSPVVVDQLAADPSSLTLGGKRKEISVMFSDIVGFTSLAEDLSPEDTVTLLNDYLTAMTEVIFGFGGTLDKYQGDAIMALFGAPLNDEHHAVNACSTALGMRKALIGLHEKWNLLPTLPFKDQLIKLDFRVGIASGNAVIGNVGSERRFDYTAIGDIVNLGSRLESVNKMYGTRVILDKETFIKITENHNPFIFRKLDTVRVKGKKNETEIFELVTFIETLADDVKEMLDLFENGRILYSQRNFKDAKQYFENALTRVAGDGPSQIYLNRCNFFIRKPPNRDWEAVVNLEEK